jgi:polar amino acid transport system ATP-binding protein
VTGPAATEGLSVTARLAARDVDLSLSVPPGATVAVTGHNGAGKSTLFAVLAGLLVPDTGRCALDGTVLFDLDATGRGRWVPPHERGIALMAQEPLLFPHLSVLENVLLAPERAHGLDRREATDAARALLARFGLGGREGDYPDRLSGGQQQRVAIIRALATRPRALLLDEITSALDPELVGEVLAVVRELKEEGMTMLIATHEMGFARDVADEVCFLHEGRIAERGAPERVLSEPEQPETQRFLRRLLEAGRA